MKRLVRVLALTAACSAAIYGGACSSSDTTEQDEENPALTDVVYDGDTNDEALEAMLDATPVSDPTRGASFDMPTEGEALAAATPPMFMWHTGGTTGSYRATRPGSALAGLLDLVGGEREAFAHGPPVNGKAFFLVVSSPSNDKLLRVFTASTSYTPTAAEWDAIKAAGGTITATVLTGAFDNNVLGSDGGPFLGVPVTFTVAQ